LSFSSGPTLELYNSAACEVEFTDTNEKMLEAARRRPKPLDLKVREKRQRDRKRETESEKEERWRRER
jgi:hypothetical protein